MSTQPPSAMPSTLAHRVQVPVWAVMLGVGASVLAGLGVATLANADRGIPRVVQGTITAVNSDVTAIGFTEDGGGRAGEGLPMAGDSWTDREGANYGGTPPTCLVPGSFGQRVELAILDFHGQGNWPNKMVVWVHCLS
jgi:hypothetical protein